MLHLREYISENHPGLQGLFNEIERSGSLAMMVMNTLRFVFGLGVAIVEAELGERAPADWEWGDCPECGQRLQSKGWVGRQMTTMLGQIRWESRVGRCPQRCAISLVVPLDQPLGIEAHQQTSWELPKIACGLAVFVPFEIAALL